VLVPYTWSDEVLDLDKLIKKARRGKSATLRPQTAAIIGGIWSWFMALPILTKILVGAIAVGGLMIAARLLQRPRLDLEEPSRHYGFNARRNSTGAGLPIPVVYGTHPVFGHVIQQFIETEDDLEFLYTLYLMSEGPIQSISDVKINEQPQANFANVQTEVRLGTPTQTAIRWFGETRTTVPVGIDINVDGTSHVYTTAQAVDAFIARVRFPAGLPSQDLAGAAACTVTVEYRVARSAAGWTLLTTSSVGSNRATNISRQFRADNLTRDYYEIRVTRVSTTGTQGAPPMQYDSADEIQYGASTYPNMALLGTRIQATDQLSGEAPRISALVQGRTVRLLSGGVLGAEEFTNNPVQCLIDFLTNTRYGLGGWVKDADLDLPSFQTVRDYCNETVADPVSESRHYLDLVLDQQKSEFDWIDIILGTFRGLLIESDGRWRLTMDHTGSVTQLFSDANIIKGSWQNRWVSLAEEYDQVEVAYLDAANDYIRDTVRFPENPVGFKTKQIELRGITRRSQALREAKYHMNAIAALSRYCECDAAIEALAVEVGDLIQVSHNVPQWGFSGRVVRTRLSDVAPTAAMMSSQGVTEFSAANLIDGDMLTKGWNLAGAAVGDWVQFDFGAGNEKNLTRVRIYQDAASYTGTYDVQHSPDGTAWTNASTGWAPTAVGWNERTWAGPGTRRFWRLRVAGIGTGHVFEIEWSSATSKHVITVDRRASGGPDTLPTAGLSAYGFAIRHSNDAVEQLNTIEAVTALADSAEGYGRADVQLSTVFARPPVARDSIWAFGTITEVAKIFRVVAITLNEDLTRHVTALEYNASIYDSAGLVLPARSPSLLPNPLQAPNDVTNITLRERRIAGGTGQVESFLEVSWSPSAPGGGAGQYAYGRVYASLYQGADATLLRQSAALMGRADRLFLLIGPFPNNLSPGGTRVVVYVAAVSTREIAQALSDAASTEITLAATSPPAIYDEFNYTIEPGHEVDPNLWLASTSGTGVPEIANLAGHEIVVATGTTDGNAAGIQCKRSIRGIPPLLRRRLTFRAIVSALGGTSGFTFGLTGEIGYLYGGGSPTAYILRGTNPGTVLFSTGPFPQQTNNIPVDPTAYHIYAIEQDVNPAVTRLYVDGVLVATHALVPAPGAVTPIFTIQIVGEMTSRSFGLDFMSYVGIW